MFLYNIFTLWFAFKLLSIYFVSFLVGFVLPLTFLLRLTVLAFFLKHQKLQICFFYKICQKLCVIPKHRVLFNFDFRDFWIGGALAVGVAGFAMSEIH